MNGDLGVVAQGSSLKGTVVVGVDDAAMEVAIGSHSGFLVIEPLRGHALEVVRGHVADPRGDLSSRNHSV